MKTKSVISLTTGLEDAEKVTVAFLVAVGSAEAGRPTLMFLTKEAARLVVGDIARGHGLRGLPAAGGPGAAVRRRPAVATWSARSASTPGTWTRATCSSNAELGGTVPMWEWIGDEPANTFSY